MARASMPPQCVHHGGVDKLEWPLPVATVTIAAVRSEGSRSLRRGVGDPTPQPFSTHAYPARARKVQPRKMSMLEAHQLLGHTRTATAIRRTCAQLKIELTDNDTSSLDNCLSCKGNTMLAHAHQTNVQHRDGDGACDFKTNITSP